MRTLVALAARCGRKADADGAGGYRHGNKPTASSPRYGNASRCRRRLDLRRMIELD